LALAFIVRMVFFEHSDDRCSLKAPIMFLRSRPLAPADIGSVTLTS
jgi:hypothetical protein